MGKPLAITQRQAETLLKAAEGQQGIVEIKTEIGIVRLIPKSLAKEAVQVDDEIKGHF